MGNKNLEKQSCYFALWLSFKSFLPFFPPFFLLQIKSIWIRKRFQSSDLFVFSTLPQRGCFIAMQNEWCERQINQNFGTVIFRGLNYYRKSFTLLKHFEAEIQKFNLESPLTSKTPLPNILKIASNQWISSKDWWKVWIVGKGCTITKCPLLRRGVSSFNLRKFHGQNILIFLGQNLH